MRKKRFRVNVGRFSQKSKVSTAGRLPRFYEQMRKILYRKHGTKKIIKNRNEPISIEKMAFQKPLAPNGTVITMVS